MTDRDWTFGYVIGRSDRQPDDRRVGHPQHRGASRRSAMRITWCWRPARGSVSVTAITPTLMGGGATMTNVTVTGSGFSGGTPEVYLVQHGQPTRPPMSRSEQHVADLFVRRPAGTHEHLRRDRPQQRLLRDAGGGGDSRPDGAGQRRLRGCPTPAALRSADPSDTEPVYAWSFLDELVRDDPIHLPTCPSLPFTAGGHYASMTTGEGEIERAWQTLKTNPHGQYTFTGYFAGGGSNVVTIKLVDGAAPGRAGDCVHDRANRQRYLRLAEQSVSGYALSALTTVVWEMTDAIGPCATHADGLTVLGCSATRSCRRRAGRRRGPGRLRRVPGLLAHWESGRRAAPGHLQVPGHPGARRPSGRRDQ